MDLENYVCEINNYFHRFFALNPKGIAQFFEGHDIHDRDGNVMSKEARENFVAMFEGVELVASSSIIGTPIGLTLNHDDQCKLISLQPAEQKKLLRELTVKSRQEQTCFMPGIKYDKIRDKSCAEENDPFPMWDRCIKAYKEYAKFKKAGKKRFYHIIAKELDYIGAVDNATDRVQEDIKTAIVFINRAINYTFPYDENCQWAYRHLFKSIQL
ncbi:MAG: hypothetical protein EG822_16800 [Deltaproteobacteria bacterium]|nr:hypothetical protein [Deltaproteobacteria bacterium]TLN01413.1 MAG: hypothetical protein FDZ73_15905 [bacterium]